MTGALSRISLDDEDDLKLHKGSEGLSFSHLPGNLSSQGGILLQVPKITHNPVNELNDPLPKKEMNVERGPLYLCPEGNMWPLDFGDAHQEQSLESEYMVLPRRTLSLKPFNRDHGKHNMRLADLSKGRQQGDTDSYPNFLSVDHINLNLTPPYVPAQHQFGLPFKQPPSVRQILASEMNERSRTMPRTVPGPSLSAGSLEVRGGRHLFVCVCNFCRMLPRSCHVSHSHYHYPVSCHWFLSPMFFITVYPLACFAFVKSAYFWFVPNCPYCTFPSLCLYVHLSPFSQSIFLPSSLSLFLLT